MSYFREQFLTKKSAYTVVSERMATPHFWLSFLKVYWNKCPLDGIWCSRMCGLSVSNSGKHNVVVVSPHFAYDWQSCESESFRNFHHCQTYWRLYGLFAANEYLAECSYCTSKPQLLWNVMDDNCQCTSANHKHGHSFTDECRNSWRLPTPCLVSM